MDIGVLMRFGRIVPGREEWAVDLFTEGVEFFGEKLSEGWITFFEPYMFRTADFEAETGFFLFKGPEDKIYTLLEDEAYLHLITKANLVVEHMKVDLLTVGDRIQAQMDRFAKVRVDLAI
ncbi:MAG TPA: hypothetical protein VE669_01570 [Actinomycetota bacterium]|nr:hypothetical protein [Actinomycetota bacterium]